MRIAIVHDWLTGMRGGEKVLSLLCRLLPRADLYTLIHVPGSCDRRIEAMPIRTSVLDDLPGGRRWFRLLLPALPLVIERFDLSEYDLVVSSSHCVAKGVVRSPRAAHLCYCHTPMRYAWHHGRDYEASLGPAGAALRLLRPYLCAWDRRSASHVDRFVANSRNVAGRIRRCYGRPARVVYPPIDTGFFTPAPVAREDFYLIVSALTPYKRVEQAVEAFGNLGRPLRVIGGGPLLGRLCRRAPRNVTLLGRQDDEAVRQGYRRCRALVHPQEEDFGLTPLEAMACGAPVIAYGAGGALETVLDAPGEEALGPTGALYTPQTAEALATAVRQFEDEESRFDPGRLSAWARRFDEEGFLRQMREEIEALLLEKRLPQAW
jgi:glycosyltransferase involved in cell wall biosynthesis